MNLFTYFRPKSLKPMPFGDSHLAQFLTFRPSKCRQFSATTGQLKTVNWIQTPEPSSDRLFYGLYPSVVVTEFPILFDYVHVFPPCLFSTLERVEICPLCIDCACGLNTLLRYIALHVMGPLCRLLGGYAQADYANSFPVKIRPLIQI